LQEKKLDERSRLDVVEIERVASLSSFLPLQQEKTCNSAYEQVPLSKDTIDSGLRLREVGRAKYLSAPPRKALSFKTPVMSYLTTDNVPGVRIRVSSYQLHFQTLVLKV
jgi:hypothetical protein